MPSAQADLEGYTEFIARESPRYSNLWLNEAWEIILSLNENPRRFAAIPEAEELGEEIRAAFHYSHRIVFWIKETEKTVEVLPIYHSARKPLTARDLE